MYINVHKKIQELVQNNMEIYSTLCLLYHIVLILKF